MTGFEWTADELQGIVDEHLVVLFMKGSPEAPQCGFSNRAAQVLNQLGHPYASVDVLSDRRAIPSICQWSDFPTMPQVFIGSELIGGSDIVLELLQSGDLKTIVEEARTVRGMEADWSNDS